MNKTPDGMICQLDATNTNNFTLTGSRVDVWKDTSGWGNDFVTGFAGTSFNPTYNASLFNGHGGVHFDGSNKFLESVAALNPGRLDSYAVLMVVNRKAGPNPYLLNDKTSGLLFGWGVGDQAGVNTKSNSQYACDRNQNVVYGMISNANGRTYFINGKERPEFWTAGPDPVNTPFGVLQLAGIQPGGSAAVDIGEVRIYNYSDNIRMMAESLELMDKFDIPQDVGSDTNLLFIGNSIMQGYYSNSLSCVPDAIKQIGFSQVDYTNLGRSADYFALMMEELPKYVRPLYDRGKKNNVVVVWEITNSLTDISATVAGIQQQLQDYCNVLLMYGFEVIVATCLPRTLVAGQNPNFEANRLSINTWIRANYLNFASGLADVGGDVTIGVTGANTNTTYYYSDGIHLIDAGHHIVANYFKNALVPLIM